MTSESNNQWRSTRLNLGQRELVQRERKELEMVESILTKPTIGGLSLAVNEAKKAVLDMAVAYTQGKKSKPSLDGVVVNYLHTIHDFNNNTQKIHYWSNYSWCHDCDLEEAVGSGWSKFGEAQEIRVDLSMDDEDIAELVQHQIGEMAMITTF